ncbi:MAG: DUF2147 domain-containing protein [Bacteroidota bacterium]
MKKTLLATALITIFSIPAFCQQDIEGIWLAGEGNTKVEIYKKDNQQYAGKIVWMKKPINKKGEPHKDKMNPDKSLRDRTLMGLHLLENLTYKNGKWHGTIYSPKRGKTLDAVVALDGADQLAINVTFRGFSRQQKWERSTL